MKIEAALDYNPFAGDFGSPGDLCFRDKIVKFRKAGTCPECRQEVEPKTLGRSLTMLWEGDGIMTYRICNACTVAMAIAIETEDFGPMDERFALGEKVRMEYDLR